ncbi:hypothetical protein B0G71_4367 [Paraburkholderia sp. BL27I4N3]|uniref:hypothetical protein n=1 Tax=Paraburkholderia sp. BL27I4N3 TaxID=1938805 RepID=UPI000E26DA28|nr:hypothetical protein [Paraburkholderia sp. BL27I4N3]REE21215.1 hypothetical protein B0G71_4367 [Paraburkholderia sp. BL27I4N3]
MTKPILDHWENPGSDTRPGSTKPNKMRAGGSESKDKLYNGTADAVFASHTGQKVGSRIPVNKELVKGYDFKENWGKD